MSAMQRGYGDTPEVANERVTQLLLDKASEYDTLTRRPNKTAQDKLPVDERPRVKEYRERNST